MPEFFTVVGASERRGPFATMKEAIALLKDISENRGHTPEQASRFFLIGSAIEQEETVGTKREIFQVGWLAREQWGRVDDCREDAFVAQAA